MSAPQRTCGGCEGSGSSVVNHGPARHQHDWSRTARGGERTVYVCGCGAEKIVTFCPVCAGRGSVDAKASREDAVADALTLLRWAEGVPIPIDDFDWRARTEAVSTSEKILRIPVRDVEWPEALWRISGESLAFIYASAAGSAFRAIPGLR